MENPDDFVANIIRTIICAQAAFAMGLAFYIFAHHAIYRHYTQGGLLRRHIVTISLSYVLLTIFVGLEIINRFGADVSYRIPLGLVGFTLGDYALMTMVLFVYRRERAAAKRWRSDRESGTK
jgi:hypothetical protein